MPLKSVVSRLKLGMSDLESYNFIEVTVFFELF